MSAATRTWWLAALVCALASLGPPDTAAAQAPSPPAQVQYDQLISRAVEEFESGHFQEAQVWFERAHALQPSARTLRGLGLCAFELRHYARAEQLLTAALRDERKALSLALQAQIEEVLVRTRAYVGRFEITVEPEGAQITIDGGQDTLRAPALVSLDPGEHTLRVTHAGYEPAERKLEVSGGQRDTLRITLKRVPVAQSPPSPAPSPELTETPQASGTALPLVLVVAGGLSAGAGAVLGLLALDRSAPDASDDEAKSARGLALGSDLALGAGLLAVGVGLVWMLTSDDEPERRAGSTALAPLLTPDGLSLHARGRF